MMKQTKKLFAGMIAIGVVLASTGCGSAGGQSPTGR